MAETTLTTDQARLEEDKFLKVGYAAMLYQRYPFQPPGVPSYNEENAFIIALEREYLEIPESLEFPNLKGAIPVNHHERLQAIWEAVVEHYHKFFEFTGDLEAKWTEEVPMDLLDDNSARIMEESPMKIRADFANGVRAIISDSTDKPNLGRWQRAERGLRIQLQEENEKFMIALRLYYEMLLETSSPSKETGEKKYVLPKNHPLRDEIAARNNYLRVINAERQGFSISQSAHHEQREARMRKAEKKPATVHESDVTRAAIFDVLPFILERDMEIVTYTQDGAEPQTHTIQQNMSELSIVLATVGHIHDIVEDTALSLEELISNYVGERTDFIDSSLDQLIESGFKEEPFRTREDIKKRVLNLIKDHTLKIVTQLMRILSNNYELSEKERKTAVEQSLAGREATIKLLDISDEEVERWNPDSIKQKQSRTFEEFPEEEEHDNGKTTKFLIRLTALTSSPQRQQKALIFKLEDRANSLITLASFRPEKQRRIIRTTTSRIIAWAMLDHDNSGFPLYNALPRAIDCAVRAYYRLHAKHPDVIETTDHRYMKKLTEWQTQVRRFKLPQKVQAIAEAHRALVRQKVIQALQARSGN
ncbi:MAG: hypothetical protein AAB953_02535 [Patescibacteria group bacterium]